MFPPTFRSPISKSRCFLSSWGLACWQRQGWPAILFSQALPPKGLQLYLDEKYIWMGLSQHTCPMRNSYQYTVDPTPYPSERIMGSDQGQSWEREKRGLGERKRRAVDSGSPVCWARGSIQELPCILLEATAAAHRTYTRSLLIHLLVIFLLPQDE